MVTYTPRNNVTGSAGAPIQLGSNSVPSTTSINLSQGQSFTDSAGRTGIVNYDAQTGTKLALGASTISPYSNQSTTTLSSDKSKDILNTSNGIQSMSDGRGITTNADTGASTYANGSVYDPKTDTSDEDDEINSILKGMLQRTDSDTADSLQSIGNKYTLLKQQQEKVNTANEAASQGGLFRSGAAQGDAYANNTQNYQVQQGLNAIQDLDMKQEDEVIAAKAAQSAGYDKVAELKLQNAQAIKTRKLALADKVNEDLATAKATADAAKAQSEKESATIDLYNQGITDPAEITQSLLKAGYPTTLKEVSDNVALLSGIGGTGIIGEYNFYKSQAKAAGQVPVDFNTYQNLDANRKKSIAAAGVAGASGYTPAVLTKITAKAGQFDNEQSVKNYQVVAEGKSFLDSIPNDTKNPSDQQGAIYAFAKIMDPNSVVREGEYNTVQKYAQSWAKTFGFKAERIFSNQPFLTSDALKNMKATIDAKVNASKKSYDNIYDEYGRVINKISGGKDGTDFLTDYSQGYGATGDELLKSGTDNPLNLDTSGDINNPLGI